MIRPLIWTLANVPTSQPSDDQTTLVVALDGTLVKTDMLHESFWAALSDKWTVAGTTLLAGLRGKAALKHHLGARADFDPATLPYDADVLALIKDRRAAGSKIVLLTGNDQTIADQIAAHLGLFDTVQGSDGSANMKGAAKAKWIDESVDGAFDYVGFQSADSAVWKAAQTAISVDAPLRLRRQIDALGRPGTLHLGRQPDTLAAYLRSMRPHQWLKNVLVFLPMLAAHQLDGQTLLLSALAFLAFSMVASSVYVFNDLLDLRADRAHPRKRNRPFASGLLPLGNGAGLGLALLASGGMISLALGPPFLAVMIAYFLITLAYSLRLKRLMVVDICALAVLYTIRIVAGGAATAIPISVWLIAFALFFFFALAAVKRQAELVDDAATAASDGQIAGRGYNTADLPIISQMALASGFVAVLVMALYVNSPAVSGLYNQPAALWGICLILLYWISRIVLLTHRGQMHDDPVVFAARDRTSQICGVLVLACAAGGALLG